VHLRKNSVKMKLVLIKKICSDKAARTIAATRQTV